MKSPRFPGRAARVALLAALAATALPGCVPLIVAGGAAVAGATVALDRRDTRTKLTDENLEVTAIARLNDALGTPIPHINVTSYNRKVLLTGEVPDARARELAEQTVRKLPDVLGVVNELAVMPDTAFPARARDSAITGRVKTNLFDANGVPGNSIKVVTERGTTYLMGRLTQREALLATEVARRTNGVERVVRVFDFISEQEALHPADPPTAAGASAAPTTSSGAQSTPVGQAQQTTGSGEATGVVTTPVTSPTIVNTAPQPIEVKPLPPMK